ncbi:MAG: carboxypeptidase-like regulatory domain-containing protein [Acidobacteriota bacterium]
MTNRHIRTIALAVLTIIGSAASAQTQQQNTLSDVVEILGNVSSASRPVGSALVIALNLSTFYAAQTFSNETGAFRLPPLRAGVYRIITVKQGFTPAIATIIPTSREQTMAIRLQTEKPLNKQQKEDIWEIRNALPKDVLREIDLALSDGVPDTQRGTQHFAAEMVSMAGLSEQTLSPSLAQTAVGVRGDVGGGWQLNFRGDIHRMADPSVDAADNTPLSESSGVVMELRSEPGSAYRIASTRSSWKILDRFNDGGPNAADLESHNFEWQRPGAKVQVRYMAEQNVYQTRSNSELFEVYGNKILVDSSRSQFGVSVRLGQENYGLDAPTALPHRLAEVSATGSFSAASPISLQYGLLTRVAENGTELSPLTGASIRLGRNVNLVVTGLYKVVDNRVMIQNLPSLVFWSDPSNVSPQYRYSVGIISGDGSKSEFSAIGSVAEIDANARVVFDDGFEQLGDSLYLEPGDQRRDLTVKYRRNLGKLFAVDMSGTAGSAVSQVDPGQPSKYYLVGDLQSLFRPTGTSINVAYRQIGQPETLANSGLVPTKERLNVVMGQSLHLPLDIRVLVGVELARLSDIYEQAQNEPDGYQRRYIGGLSFAF